MNKKKLKIKSYKDYIHTFSKYLDDAEFKEMMLRVVEMFETRNSDLIAEINAQFNEYGRFKEYRPRRGKIVERRKMVNGKIQTVSVYDPNFYKTSIWKKMRQIPQKIFGSKCMCCGSTEKIYTDHVIPRKDQPKLEIELTNFQVLCEKCNSSKKDGRTDYRTPEQIQMLRDYKQKYLIKEMNTGLIPPLSWDYETLRNEVKETKVILRKRNNVID